jgi:hypothetical protein
VSVVGVWRGKATPHTHPDGEFEEKKPLKLPPERLQKKWSFVVLSGGFTTRENDKTNPVWGVAPCSLVVGFLSTSMESVHV